MKLFKIGKLKKVMVGMFSLALLFSVGACSTGEKTPSEETDNGPKTYDVGDVVELEDMNFTVNKVYEAESTNQFAKPKEGNVFVAVDLTIENTSDKEQTISSLMMFKVVDKDGRSCDYSLTGMMAVDAGQMDGTLGAGRKMSGVYVVEVPAGTTGLELEFTSSFVGGKQIIVKLN